MKWAGIEGAREATDAGGTEEEMGAGADRRGGADKLGGGQWLGGGGSVGSQRPDSGEEEGGTEDACAEGYWLGVST